MNKNKTDLKNQIIELMRQLATLEEEKRKINKAIEKLLNQKTRSK